MISVPVSEQSQVAEARRAATDIARRAGFGEVDTGRVAIAATELATNLIKHGGGGRMLAGLAEGSPAGQGAVELIGVDNGAGIVDLGAALRDGYSTVGSAGQGLGAIRRQAHAFSIYSRRGSGTAVFARFETGRPPASTSVGEGDGPQSQPPCCGAVCVALRGEEVCGDDWHVHGGAPGAGDRKLMVVDGLGHGPHAAKAAAEAVRLFVKHAGEPLTRIMEALHAGLHATRGAAVSLARFDSARRVVVFCGVGNVSGALVSGVSGEMRRMMSHNGTVGHAMRRIQEIDYPYPDEDGVPLVVLHSDGLSANWSFAAYPGLVSAHPTLIAAVLYRDLARERDDATVLVASGERALPQ